MLSAVSAVVSECWANRSRLIRLAGYELRAQNSGTLLGVLWNLISPALQILIFWFVFEVGLKAAPPSSEHPYIIWMMFGIMPWFYISAAMMGSTGAILSFSGVLKHMSFPPAIVPVKSVLSAFFAHLFAMCVAFAVHFLSGCHLTPSALWLPYYMLCSLCFLTGFALFASALSAVVRDFQKLMGSIIRLLFYISPVVWSPDKLAPGLRFALKLNPLAYIIDGYRASILYAQGPAQHCLQGAYFWAFTLSLFALGCVAHMRLRRQFMDLI